MNSMHDVGGSDGFGPIPIEPHEPVFHEDWEARMRAIDALVTRRGIYNVDETRHAIERINPVYYLGSSYYQIWLLRMEALLIEKGVLTKEELEGRMKELTPDPPVSHLQPFRKLMSYTASAQRNRIIPGMSGSECKEGVKQPKYSRGDRVRVKVSSPLGHTRVPRYVRGREGIIEKLHGYYHIPDVRVETGIKVYQPVYLVCFRARDLWGEGASPKDKLYIEMYEDYIEPVRDDDGQS